jgi:hypothetical protein
VAFRYVDALWVRDDHRTVASISVDGGRGERGTPARLSPDRPRTHSFQAPSFYERRGFQRVGEIAGYPSGHSLISLAKRLR